MGRWEAEKVLAARVKVSSQTFSSQEAAGPRWESDVEAYWPVVWSMHRTL